MNFNKYKKDFISLIVNIFITLLAVFVIYGLWNRDFSIPIVYNYDGVGGVAMFKKAEIGEKFSFFQNLRSPYGEDIYSQDFLLSYVLVKFVMLFTSDIGIGVNVYWLLTYVLTAITCYCFLRKLNCGYSVSIVGSIIYNFLPYHYFRLEHFWLMGCFTIPLVGCLVIDLYENESNSKVKKDNIIYYIQITIFSLLIGMSGIYFSFFSIVILGFTMLYVSLKNKKIKYLFKFLYETLMIVLPIIIFVVIPSVFFNGNTVEALSQGRDLSQINAYGLNFLLMFLPIPGHRIGKLSNFTENIFEQTNITTEGFMVSLGLFMTIGFLISVIFLFKEDCKEIWQLRLKRLGYLNIIIVMFATIGGLANFVGIFVTVMIRCYNRMSVFIALFSVGSISITIEILYSKVKIKHNWIRGLICLLIMIVALLDQTSPNFAKFESYDISSRSYILENSMVKKQYQDEKEYLSQVYNDLDDQRMVYIFPVEPTITADNANIQFNRLRLYLHDIGSEYTVTDSDYKEWFSEMEKTDQETQLRVLSIMGFSGIILDKNAFMDEASFEKTKKTLEEYMDSDAKINSDGTLYFYSFKDIKQEYLNEYSEQELTQIREDIYQQIYTKYEYINMNDIIGLDSEKILKQGQMQMGPNINLKKGKYEVLLLGENLLNSDIRVTVGTECKEIPIKEKTINDTFIEYEFELDNSVSDVNFTLKNEKNDVCLKQYFFQNVKGEKKSIREQLEKNIEINEKLGLGSYTEELPLSIFFTKGRSNIDGDEILLENGALQYGPYKNLNEGVYEITIDGKNLQGTIPEVTFDCGKEKNSIELVFQESEKIVYRFTVNEYITDVEFLLYNDTKETVYINKYQIKKIKEY